MDNLTDISVLLNDCKEKCNYYISLFSKYGFEKTILFSLQPISLKEQEQLYNRLSEDTDFLAYFLQEIDKKYGAVGLSHFYNAIYYNLIDYLKETLENSNLEFDWNDKVFNGDYSPLSIYYDETYYGDLDVFNREYSMASNSELIDIINKVKELEADYNKDNETINNLYLEIDKKSHKKSILQKAGIMSIDLAKKDKAKYEDLMDAKYENKLKLDALYTQYNKTLKKFTNNRVLDEELNTKINKNLNMEIFLTEDFPTIETYVPAELTNEEQVYQYTDIQSKFKYDE
jgi:hypothetical protein